LQQQIATQYIASEIFSSNELGGPGWLSNKV